MPATRYLIHFGPYTGSAGIAPSATISIANGVWRRPRVSTTSPLVIPQVRALEGRPRARRAFDEMHFHAVGDVGSAIEELHGLLATAAFVFHVHQQSRGLRDAFWEAGRLPVRVKHLEVGHGQYRVPRPTR